MGLFMIILAAVPFPLALIVIVTVTRSRERGRQQKMIEIRRRGSIQAWKVHKQVVVIKPETTSHSKEIALRDMNPQPEFIPLDWPRMLRITITNRSNIVLIGEARIDEEQRVNDIVQEAETRCTFLNAHEVV